jgi:ribosomal protein S18 acetylase RimI-like enzyme
MSASIATRIARATDHDVERMSTTMAEAFHDDPVVAWIVRDPGSRPARLRSVFASEVRSYLRLGETFRDEHHHGAALWAPPGERAVTEAQAEEQIGLLAEILQEDLDRALMVSEIMEQHHPDVPCYYLQWLGVSPGHQGRGIGSHLLRTVLRRCDATATPAYLEATSTGNRRLYERHGFRTVSELTIPGGPPMWPMWREPMTIS